MGSLPMGRGLGARATFRIRSARGLACLAVAGAMLLAAGVIGWAQTPDPPQAAAPPAPAKADNPHWNPARCATCHTDRPAAIAPVAADTLCMSCHDGVRARDENHPVGRRPDARLFTVPPDWPLSDGRTGCLTCHDVKKQCLAPHERPMLNPMFLRGRVVGNVVNALCTTCHRPELLERFNPHVMLDGDAIVQAKCDFCHAGPLPRQAKVRTGQTALVREEVAFCRGCHTTHMEYFNPGHVGARLTPEMRRRLAEKPAALGPLRDGRIICTTCHNPHQQGVFGRTSELAVNALKPVGPDKVVSGINANVLCVSCHDMARGSVALRAETGPRPPEAPEAPAPAPADPQDACPVDAKPLGAAPVAAVIRGRAIRFDSMQCLRSFQVDPERYMRALPAPTPPTTQPQQ